MTAVVQEALDTDFMTTSTSPRDWPEDFLYESGNYMCRCSACHETFVGYKRRVVCKVCHDRDAEEAKRRAEWLNARSAPKGWLIMTESEIASIKADLARLVWDNSEMKRLLERVWRYVPNHSVEDADLIYEVEKAIGS